jgi:hypothetical protein
MGLRELHTPRSAPKDGVGDCVTTDHGFGSAVAVVEGRPREVPENPLVVDPNPLLI